LRLDEDGFGDNTVLGEFCSDDDENVGEQHFALSLLLLLTGEQLLEERADDDDDEEGEAAAEEDDNELDEGE
jgi:hypothetical protein